MTAWITCLDLSLDPHYPCKSQAHCNSSDGARRQAGFKSLLVNQSGQINERLFPKTVVGGEKDT